METTNTEVQSEEKFVENDNKESSLLETMFENTLWSARFLVLFAVISSLFAALVLFIIGSVDMFHALRDTFNYYLGIEKVDVHTVVIGTVIGAVDIYLIAVVLVIFSFGLYELFISHIDAAAGSEASGILEIHSLDMLKDKVAKVIIMALVVKYFQMVLEMASAHKFDSAQDMFYLAISIFALSFGLYFLHKGGSAEH